MAQKVEQWLSRDGTAHATEEAANGNDNDLALGQSLGQFVEALYKANPEQDNLFRRLERQQLVMALFRSRKPLLDALLKHNAGPTLRPVDAPQKDIPPVPPAEGGKPPLGIPPKPNASPAGSGGGTSSIDAKPEIPDNFIFNTDRKS